MHCNFRCLLCLQKAFDRKIWKKVFRQKKKNTILAKISVSLSLFLKLDYVSGYQ